MDRAPTEYLLQNWRNGQAQAERLCAGLLFIEGFTGIDPQCPLGGPDGLKDVICQKDGKKWVAAVYFPTTKPTLPELKKKFRGDFQGVAKNAAEGFAFFANQRLSPSQRGDLMKIASPSASEIYHLERLRAILDSPKGYGLRLEHLQIPMSTEEQLAFWSSFNYDITRKLIDNESRLDSINAKLDLVLMRTTSLAADLLRSQSSVTKNLGGVFEVECPTSNLTLGMLCWVHRLVSEDLSLPDSVRGRLRSVQVWVGKPSEPSFTPPPPERIPELINQFIGEWRTQYGALLGQSKELIVRGLADFHHRFLLIHPFLDANGRVARVLLDQAARELLNQSVGSELSSDPERYRSALQKADAGSLEGLEHLILASLN